MFLEKSNCLVFLVYRCSHLDSRAAQLSVLPVNCSISLEPCHYVFILGNLIAGPADETTV